MKKEEKCVVAFIVTVLFSLILVRLSPIFLTALVLGTAFAVFELRRKTVAEALTVGTIITFLLLPWCLFIYYVGDYFLIFSTPFIVITIIFSIALWKRAYEHIKGFDYFSAMMILLIDSILFALASALIYHYMGYDYVFVFFSVLAMQLAVIVLLLILTPFVFLKGEKVKK